MSLIFGVHCQGALTNSEERGQGEKEVPVFDEFGHLPEEEGHKKRSNMGAVDIGIGHDNDALVAEFFVVIGRARTATQTPGSCR